MTHPIVALQGALVAALRADVALSALVGDAVLDAPAEGQGPPYVVIARHDVLPRDGDVAPGYEHRLLLHVWADQPSRRAVLANADRVIAVAMSASLDGDVRVTHRRHERTDTAIDTATGFARAAVAITFFSEPG